MLQRKLRKTQTRTRAMSIMQVDTRGQLLQLEQVQSQLCAVLICSDALAP